MLARIGAYLLAIQTALVVGSFPQTARPKVDASPTHGIYLTSQGTIMAWGSNAGGAFCGGGPQIPRGASTLQEIPGIAGVADIAVGQHLTFLIMRDGAALACGENSDFQAGVGQPGVTVDYYKRQKVLAKPTPVTGLRNPKQMAIGGNFVVALLDDGRVMAWGARHDGRLGDIAATDPAIPGIVSFPRPLSAISGAREIAAGATFTLALMNDGTVKGWGLSRRGELGSETGGIFARPVAVPGLSGVRHIVSTAYNAAALLDDGTVKVWGEGQLGMVWSRASDQSVLGRDFAQPVRVPGLSQVAALYGGFQGTNFIAVLQDGTVRMWGYNGFYQQGLGNNEEYPLRLASPKVKGVVSAVSAYNGTYFLMADGKLLNAGAHHGRPRQFSLKIPTEIWPSYPPLPR
jgi:alpha-tubulin suppressor-like RCC1 family protein